MPGSAGSGGGGLLDKLSTLVEKLAELAEKGEQLRKSGELTSSDDKIRGAYELDVRVGVGADEQEDGAPRSEPKEEAPRGVSAGEPAVHPVREPLVDVFDEEVGVLVVAQLPGVPCRDVVLELRGDILTVDGTRDDVTYHKEILLPRSFSKEQMRATCRNGIVEIRMSEAP